jgi:hypothetical protein
MKLGTPNKKIELNLYKMILISLNSTFTVETTLRPLLMPSMPEEIGNVVQNLRLLIKQISSGSLLTSPRITIAK